MPANITKTHLDWGGGGLKTLVRQITHPDDRQQITHPADDRQQGQEKRFHIPRTLNVVLLVKLVKRTMEQS